jgi:Kef-type K+ transport system membrane component KefB
VAALLAVKMGTKMVGVWPLARMFNIGTRDANFTTMLMSTGLTFGSISALFGLMNGIIDQEQYSILVAVVIASAVVPTLIAQAFFQPPPPGPAVEVSRQQLRADGAEDEYTDDESDDAGSTPRGRAG